MNTISPAYMLPNRRSESEIGLAISSIRRKSRLTGAILAPKGTVNTSCMKPPKPFTLKPMTIMTTKTLSDMPKVRFGSVVGTTLK